MNLREALSQINCNVKIGAKDGSGFWYCGTSPDIDKMDRYVRRMWAHMMDSNTERMLGAGDTFPSWQRYQSGARIKGYPINWVEFSKYINRWCRSCDKIRRLRAEYQNNIANLIPMGEREVKEIYRSCTEESLIILVEGQERCKWWDTKEFKEDEYGDYEGSAEVYRRRIGNRIK